MSETVRRRLPPWFKRRLVPSPAHERTRRIVRELALHTVCESAECPNRAECFAESTATIMILGDRCTRDCRFCAVKPGAPSAPDADEAERVAEAVRLLGLRYVVITSVTRDDLFDQGAGQFVRVLEALRRLDPVPVVELLTPDFSGNVEAWELVAAAKPEVWGHNVEVVPRRYAKLRPGADYERSIALLAWAKRRDPGMVTKSAFMVGVGETREEIMELCRDLRRAAVDVVVVGQYLAPSRDHYPVERFYAPEEFAELAEEIRALGFRGVLAEPRARSSYRAEGIFRALSG